MAEEVLGSHELFNNVITQGTTCKVDGREVSILNLALCHTNKVSGNWQEVTLCSEANFDNGVICYSGTTILVSSNGLRYQS